MTDFTFDKNKAVASMLYICQSLGGSWDRYSLLKILYFAEKKHLATYGRPITGDNIDALPYGPVPSISYDTIKNSKVNPEFFEIDDNIVIAKKEPNMDVLSESDIECLDFSVKENKALGFGGLKIKSHDIAYNWAIENQGLNSTIPYIEIARAGGADENMIRYIKYNSETQSCDLNATSP